MDVLAFLFRLVLLHPPFPSSGLRERERERERIIEGKIELVVALVLLESYEI